MSNTNAYIIFEADQVLTNDHLNEMFDYLDTQERLSRNKLIGIGIVCGLEISTQPASIILSKGCGITSKGYLVVQDDLSLTQSTVYTLPADPFYQPFVKEATGKQYDLWRLLTDKEAAATEAVKQPVSNDFLKDKIVVLFLEASETDLKNCDTQDCNEKGRQMQLTVRPLLIFKDDMEEIVLKQKKLFGDEGLSDSYIERLGLKDVPLKRFDITASALGDTFDIYNAYLKCLDDATIKNVADALSQCYSIFNPILADYESSPFKSLEADLKSKLDFVKKSMPLYLQYYYDFIDDLIKAYHEFKDRSFEVITDCCPDEDLFPMHLMLGEASADTKDSIRSPFRQYFISSPLFNNQGSLLNEVKLLFERMVSLVKGFFIPQFVTGQVMPVRITPSKWSQAPLSARAIPYYYNINTISRSWNPEKTRKGKLNYNLSYNADKYNNAPSDLVLNPLLYTIEQNDFYRIEGHIGQDFASVQKSLLSLKNSYRLPFDVIALKANTDASNTIIKYDCHFEDLETLFGVLKAELACKMHEPICLAAKVPTNLVINPGEFNPLFNFVALLGTIHANTIQDQIVLKNRVLTTFASVTRAATKGDFLKTWCPVTEGTLGFDYVNITTRFYPRPTQIDLTTAAGAKAAMYHLIDIVETLMQTVTGSATIYTFNFTTFDKAFEEVKSYFIEFMQALINADGKERLISPFLYGMLEEVVNCCIDDRLKALTGEYSKRVLKIQQQNLFSEYIKTNPGIDHKAGVPRGGTFIIVYYETPPEKTTTNITNAATTIKNLNTELTNTPPVLTNTPPVLTNTPPIVFGGTSPVVTTKTPIIGTGDTPPIFKPNNPLFSKSNAPILSSAKAVSKDVTDGSDDTSTTPPIIATPTPPVTTPKETPVVPATSPSVALPVDTKKTLPATTAISASNLTQILKIFDSNELKLNPEQADILKRLTLQKFSTAGIKDPFTIPNKAVVADFYLPYLCCSDCPPVAYILPKEEVAVIKLDPKTFCNNDAGTYPIVVSPQGGTISATGGVIIDEKKLFIPKGLPTGIIKISYKIANGSSASVDVTVTEAFEIDFKMEPVADDPLSVHFIPTGTDNKTVSWNFGDNSAASAEPSPVHKFNMQDDEQKFSVTLSASDGPCIIKESREISITRPKFFIDKNDFCSNEQQEFVIQTIPAIKDIKDIENKDGLLLKMNEAGNVVFVPADQQIKKTTKYHLAYKGLGIDLSIAAVADADFTATQVPTDPFTFQFNISNLNNREAAFDFGDGTPLATKALPASFHTYKISGDSQTFKVRLTVQDGRCTVVKDHDVVVSKPQVFSIDPLVFCSNDSVQKVFKAQPAITNVADIENKNGLKIEKNVSGGIGFTPANQGVQQTTSYHLVYKGTAIDIKILAVVDADFTTKAVDTDPLTIQFTPIGLGNRTAIWDYGDGTPVGPQLVPFHSFKISGDTQTFKVRMTVSDGICTVVKEHEVTVSKPKIKVFTIQPLVFCAFDNSQKLFQTDPAVQNITDVQNPDGLNIQKDTAGKLFFNPSVQKLTLTKTFSLTYQGINLSLKIIVPNAAFIMNITLARNIATLTLKAKQTDADGYNWKVTSVTGTTIVSTEKVFVLTYTQVNAPNGSQLTIDLSVNSNKQTGVNCAENKNFVITDVVYNAHLNKGEFDNVDQLFNQ